MTFNIYTLGCKVNAYESEVMKELLLKEGYQISVDEPDICIVNTCSVTNVADHKSMKLVRHLKKEYPRASLVVCGCSSQNNYENYTKIGVDILLGNTKKSQIVKLLKEYFDNHEKKIDINPSRQLPFEDMQIDKFTTHTRAFIKIQDGCNNFCSYCVIPYVRGTIRSKDFQTALSEIETLVLNGHKEIVLTGIHTGSYGTGTDHDLTDLIHEASKFDNLKRIRISSIEITELNDKFLEELKHNFKICNHLHIPLQAGSDEILKRMNRKYDLKYFKEKIDLIRQIRLGISITTDVIVGHPYETDELFKETIQTISDINFSKVHVFPYSVREKTAASMMKEQVSEPEKKARSKALVALSNELEENYYRSFIGQDVWVLVEQTVNEGVIGFTDNYLRVLIKENISHNKMVYVHITTLDNNKLIGEVIKND